MDIQQKVRKAAERAWPSPDGSYPGPLIDVADAVAVAVLREVERHSRVLALPGYEPTGIIRTAEVVQMLASLSPEPPEGGTCATCQHYSGEACADFRAHDHPMKHRRCPPTWGCPMWEVKP